MNITYIKQKYMRNEVETLPEQDNLFLFLFLYISNKLFYACAPIGSQVFLPRKKHFFVLDIRVVSFVVLSGSFYIVAVS